MKNNFGLVKKTLGLVHTSSNLPEWQALKLTFFAPCRSTFYVPKIRTNYGKFNIRYNGPILWNETDERFKILTPYSFKGELSLHFINFC